jgi:hypothetical protein
MLLNKVSRRSHMFLLLLLLLLLAAMLHEICHCTAVAMLRLDLLPVAELSYHNQLR